MIPGAFMQLHVNRLLFLVLALALLIAAGPAVRADDKAMIDANTERALTWLRSSGVEFNQLSEQAAGVLVFPDMVKMGFGMGGEFGEGVLLVGGQPAAYYASAGQDFGAGPEVQYKAEVIFFMTQEALDQFRNASSWKVGHHAQVPAAASVADALLAGTPHVGLIFSEGGVFSSLAFDGDNITRITR